MAVNDDDEDLFLNKKSWLWIQVKKKNIFFIIYVHAYNIYHQIIQVNRIIPMLTK